MTKPRQAFGVAAAVVLLPLFAGDANAQDAREGRNSVSLLAGHFVYDRGGDQAYPYVSVRASRQLTQFFESEISLGYSRLATKLYSFGETITPYDAYTGFLTADVAMQAQLPLKRLSPYVAVSAGLLRRGESEAYDGLAVNGSSVGLATGARLMVTREVGLRGEFKFRSDKHNGQGSRARDVAYGLGLLYRF